MSPGLEIAAGLVILFCCRGPIGLLTGVVLIGLGLCHC